MIIIKKLVTVLLPHPVIPFIKNHLPHLTESKICVWEEIPNLTIRVVGKVKQVPLNLIILIIAVAVQGGAEVIGDVPQLMCLVPVHSKYFR